MLFFCYNDTTMLILIYKCDCNPSILSDYMHSYVIHDYICG